MSIRTSSPTSMLSTSGGVGRDVDRVANRFEDEADLTLAVCGHAAERGGLTRGRSAGDDHVSGREIARGDARQLQLRPAAGNHVDNGRLVLDARGADRRRRVGAEVARLAPEVVEIGRVQQRHIAGDQHERPSALGDVVEPRPGREPRPAGLFQRGALLVVQPGVGVTASARLDRIDDRRPLVLQHPEGVDPHGEAIGDGLRRAHDVGHEPVPHAGRHLRTGDRLVGAATPTIEIAVAAVGAVDLCRHDARELRGGSVDPVAPDRRVGTATGRSFR